MRFIAIASLALFLGACAGVEQDCVATPLGGFKCPKAAVSGAPEPAKSSAILEEDEAHFVNPNRLTAFLAREHVVFDDIKSNK